MAQRPKMYLGLQLIEAWMLTLKKEIGFWSLSERFCGKSSDLSQDLIVSNMRLLEACGRANIIGETKVH